MHIFLETDRLVLRRFTDDDVDNLVDLDSDPDVMHFINGGRPTPREEIQDDVLPAFLEYYEGFAELGVQRVFAESMAVNVASRRVMEKAGLRLVRAFHQPWPEPETPATPQPGQGTRRYRPLSRAQPCLPGRCLRPAFPPRSRADVADPSPLGTAEALDSSGEEATVIVTVSPWRSAPDGVMPTTVPGSPLAGPVSTATCNPSLISASRTSSSAWPR